MKTEIAFEAIVGAGGAAWEVRTSGAGPPGELPLTAEMLLERPSGDLFGLTQNAGMGWDPRELGRPQFLILSTQGGIRAADGPPIALGYHTGPLGGRPAGAGRRARSWRASAACRSPASAPIPATAARRARRACWTASPIATTPRSCFRRLIRSLPTRKGVLGVATCDKGLPAMMMALAGAARPARRARARRRDAAADRRRGRRHGADASARASPTASSRSSEAAELGCRACGSPGGGCQFLGTAATSQVVGEALGLSLPHSRARALGPADLARHGAPLGARAGRASQARGLATRDILTDAAVRNAMVVHAAFGGSTNLLLHLPAIAHAAGLRRPDGRRLDRRSTAACRGSSTRCPTARVDHPTVRVFLAGGVPEVMLHLRRLGLLDARRADRDGRARSGACSTGGRARSGGARCASACARRTASIPTT